MERIFYAVNNCALVAKRPISSTFDGEIIRRVRFCLRNIYIGVGKSRTMYRTRM